MFFGFWFHYNASLEVIYGEAEENGNYCFVNFTIISSWSLFHFSRHTGKFELTPCGSMVV